MLRREALKALGYSAVLLDDLTHIGSSASKSKLYSHGPNIIPKLGTVHPVALTVEREDGL